MQNVTYPTLKGGASGGVWPFLNGITFIAYTPLEKGKVTQEKLLLDVGRKYGKTAVQIALNWLVSKENVIAIPKTSKEERLVEFSEAMGWRLSKEDLELLNEHYKTR